MNIGRRFPLSQQVQVHRIEEIERLRAALATFLAAADDSLLAVDLELRRFVDWIRGEQPLRLERQHRQSLEQVAQAKGALARKRLVLPGERSPDTIEEEKALRLAQQRCADLEERRASVKRWAQLVEPIIDDYRGEATQLAHWLEGNPPSSLRFLDGVLNQLRAYLEVQPSVSSSPAPTVASPALISDNTDGERPIDHPEPTDGVD
jgi:hypothetical protein